MFPSSDQFVVKHINSHDARQVTLEELSDPNIGSVQTHSFHFAVNAPTGADAGAKQTTTPKHNADEAMKADAYNQGYEAGYAAGLQEQANIELVEQKNRTDNKLETLDSALTAVEAELLANAERLADAVCARVFDLVELVIGREVAGSDDPGADALKRCLAVAPNTGDLVAYLNPQDMDTLAPDIADGLKIGSRNLEVVADQRVRSGDAMVLVNEQIIDGRLGKAFDRLVEVLG